MCNYNEFARNHSYLQYFGSDHNFLRPDLFHHEIDDYLNTANNSCNGIFQNELNKIFQITHKFHDVEKLKKSQRIMVYSHLFQDPFLAFFLSFETDIRAIINIRKQTVLLSFSAVLLNNNLKFWDH